jgi:hypothetical protein
MGVAACRANSVKGLRGALYFNVSFFPETKLISDQSPSPFERPENQLTTPQTGPEGSRPLSSVCPSNTPTLCPSNPPPLHPFSLPHPHPSTPTRLPPEDHSFHPLPQTHPQTLQGHRHFIISRPDILSRPSATRRKGTNQRRPGQEQGLSDLGGRGRGTVGRECERVSRGLTMYRWFSVKLKTYLVCS